MMRVWIMGYSSRKQAMRHGAKVKSDRRKEHRGKFIVTDWQAQQQAERQNEHDTRFDRKRAA